jgi:hypothetical protein
MNVTFGEIETLSFIYNGSPAIIDEIDINIENINFVNYVKLLNNNGELIKKVIPGDNTVVFDDLNFKASDNQEFTISLDVATPSLDIDPSTVDVRGYNLKTFLSRVVFNSSEKLTVDNVMGSDIYLYRSLPIIKDVVLPSYDLSVGTKILSKFSIEARGGGSIAWKTIPFEFNVSSEDLIIEDLILWNTYTKSKVEGVFYKSHVYDNDKDYDFVAENEQEIENGTKIVYELRAVVSGNIVNNSYINTVIPLNVEEFWGGSFSFLNYSLTGTSDSSFIWSDLSAKSHSKNTKDWFGDYLVNSLPISHTLSKDPTEEPEIVVIEKKIVSPASGDTYDKGEDLYIMWQGDLNTEYDIIAVKNSNSWYLAHNVKTDNEGVGEYLWKVGTYYYNEEELSQDSLIIRVQNTTTSERIDSGTIYINSIQEEDDPIENYGNDKDEHGCIASAGYTWCESKQKCLRTWEEDCPAEEEEEEEVCSSATVLSKYDFENMILVDAEIGYPEIDCSDGKCSWKGVIYSEPCGSNCSSNGSGQTTFSLPDDFSNVILKMVQFDDGGLIYINDKKVFLRENECSKILQTDIDITEYVHSGQNVIKADVYNTCGLSMSARAVIEYSTNSDDLGVVIPTTPPIYGEADEHNCIASAGYTWCESKQKCLRTWEEECPATVVEGVELNEGGSLIDIVGNFIKSIFR